MFAGIVTAVGWNIYRIQSEYQSGEAVYDELEQYAPTRPESNLSLVSSQSGEDTSQGDFGALLEINPDTVLGSAAKGPGSAILWSSLEAFIHGSDNSSGCIFLDS